MFIEVEKLSHIYMRGTPFEVAALRDISMSLEKGSFTGVIGQTGSGKSTLVQHLNGLLRPSSGSVKLGGQDLWASDTSLKKIRRRVGLLFQYPEEQLFEDTVFADVAFGIKNLSLPPQEVASRVQAALRKVNLDYESFKDRSPFVLSGGEKRRVAMAGVLVMEPEVIIMDEPTAGLDPGSRREVLEEIRELHRQENLTAIIVSHSMEDIAWLVESLIVLDGGEIILQGSPQEVFSREDVLKNAGLAAPEINRVLQELRAKGVDVRTDVYTIDDVEREIWRVLGGIKG